MVNEGAKHRAVVILVVSFQFLYFRSSFCGIRIQTTVRMSENAFEAAFHTVTPPSSLTTIADDVVSRKPLLGVSTRRMSMSNIPVLAPRSKVREGK